MFNLNESFHAMFSLLMSPSKTFFISVMVVLFLTFLFHSLLSFRLSAYIMSMHLAYCPFFCVRALSILIIVILNSQSDNSKFSAIPEPGSKACLVSLNKLDINKLILKFIWKGKRPRIGSSRQKNKNVEGLTLSNFKTQYKVAVIKTVWY